MLPVSINAVVAKRTFFIRFPSLCQRCPTQGNPSWEWPCFAPAPHNCNGNRAGRAKTRAMVQLCHSRFPGRKSLPAGPAYGPQAPLHGPKTLFALAARLDNETLQEGRMILHRLARAAILSGLVVTPLPAACGDSGWFGGNDRERQRPRAGRTKPTAHQPRRASRRRTARMPRTRSGSLFSNASRPEHHGRGQQVHLAGQP